MSTNQQKVAKYDALKDILYSTEPSLSKLSLHLYESLQSRHAPIPDPKYPVMHQKTITVRDIKTILVDLDVNLVPLLTGEPYSSIIGNAAFPDRENVYTGVYVGAYHHEDGTGPSVRDIVRIANILQKEKSILGIIEPLKLGEKPQRGKCWGNVGERHWKRWVPGYRFRRLTITRTRTTVTHCLKKFQRWNLKVKARFPLT
jgi:hypothetical protein